jgi:hypothetical protein
VHRRIRPALIAIATVSLVGACASRSKPVTESAGGEVELADRDVVIRVQNNYLDLVTVYAVSRGLSQRLGTVSLGSPATFRLRAARLPADGQLQIIASPLGGNGRATSGAITVGGGTVVDFTVGPTLVGSVLLR